MAKNTFVCGSAEQAALELLGHVARAEGVDLSAQHSTDRAWILDTYAECLKAAWDPEKRLSAARPDPSRSGNGTDVQASARGDEHA